MPNRKQQSEQQQRKNSIGQIQEQLGNQAQATASIESNEQVEAEASNNE